MDSFLFIVISHFRMISVNRCIGFILFSVWSFTAKAQADNPYHTNGDAFQENCNCFTLTPDANSKTGSVWNVNKINLSEPFDFVFNIYLGCHDADGADGIAFVLQPISTSIGTVGGGMGFDGVSPSVGVLIDTWQNLEDNDPAYDHISIQRNGIIDHSSANDIVTPVQAIASGGNIEDCNWHTLRVKWDPVLHRLKAGIDGVSRLEATLDMVNLIFNGTESVYWGFTAATGGAKNLQRVCTSLNAGFRFPDGQQTCFPQEVTFLDSSSSFGSILEWHWDFGDGTISDLQDPPPHNYPAPGIYEAKLQILGNNGCFSEPFVKKIVMGTKPVPGFTYSPDPPCEGLPVNFTDASTVEFGTVNKWNWSIGAQSYTGQSPPLQNLSGTNTIQLMVETQEGCVSAIKSESVLSFPVPSVDFSLSDICIAEPALLRGTNNDPSVAVRRWNWLPGDGSANTTITPEYNYLYKAGGVYDVQMTALSSDGCLSAPVTKTINVYETKANAGIDTIIAMNQSVMLNGSGGILYKWSPSAGLSADNVPNPVATLTRHSTFVLTASTEAGCQTSDTINIKVYKGPAFYVPTAFSPNNDGKNDKFRFIAVGMSTINQFQVYNRYGQAVYSSAHVNEGWDGSFNGVNQPPGTYVWLIRGVDFSGLAHLKKGTVTLIR